MKSKISKTTLLSVLLIFFATITANAKDYEVSLVSEPSGATVYLNGNMVSQTTPAVIKIDSKMVKKKLIFFF